MEIDILTYIIMKYDRRKLVSPSGPIVAVWDYTVRGGGLGKTRWLCKTAEGKLYLYWCLDDGRSMAGHWDSTTAAWCIDLTNDEPPVWSLSILDQSKPVEPKPVKPIDTSWIIRPDGSCYFHGVHPCRHK